MSKIGIVHSPFLEENTDYSRTVFATMEHGAFKLYSNEEMSRRDLLLRSPEYIDPFFSIETLEKSYRFTVAATLNHFSPHLKQILDLI